MPSAAGITTMSVSMWSLSAARRSLYNSNAACTTSSVRSTTRTRSPSAMRCLRDDFSFCGRVGEHHYTCRRVVAGQHAAGSARPAVHLRVSTPRIEVMVSALMEPARSTWGGQHERSTMVLSRPTVLRPPSNTTSRCGSSSDPRSATTCCAVVGLTRPKRLAEGAASPPPKRFRIRCASG